MVSTELLYCNVYTELSTKTGWMDIVLQWTLFKGKWLSEIERELKMEG